MINRIVYFVIMVVLWELLTWSVDIQNVLAGVIVALVTTFVVGHLFFPGAVQMFSPTRIFWFLYYIPVFLFHMVHANLDVAYRVLHMNVPIKPGIVRVETELKSDLGLTFLANSITLTPGTLTVDIIGNELYIHWINVQTEDPGLQTEIIVKKFEKIIKRVFE